MENSLKQRIVGAIVLIALAVIFLPTILKEKTQREPFESQIPAKPISLVEHQIGEEAKIKNEEVRKRLDNVEQQARKTKGAIENSTANIEEELLSSEQKQADASLDNVKSPASSEQPGSSQTELKPAEIKSANQANSKETINEQFRDAAWVIQVASFSNLDNAKKLVTRLKQNGHKAYRRAGKNQQGQAIYRIYVGPYIEKSRANSALKDVSKLAESKAILRVYDPTRH